MRSFSGDQVFDFGQSFVEEDGRFEVSLYRLQGGVFKGRCEAGQRRQYVFKITADNYIKAGPITVEVHVERCERTDDWPYGNFHTGGGKVVMSGYGSFKSLACSCVSITLSAAS